MTSSALLTNVVVRLRRFHFFFVLGKKAGGPLITVLLTFAEFEPAKDQWEVPSFHLNSFSACHPSILERSLWLMSSSMPVIGAFTLLAPGSAFFHTPLFFTKEASIFTGSLSLQPADLSDSLNLKIEIFKSNQSFLSKPPKIWSPLSPSDSDYKSLSTILLAGLAPAGT